MRDIRTGLFAAFAAVTMLASPARAAETIHPHELEMQAGKRQHVQLSDAQRALIQEGLVTAHTEQKTPKDFAATVGAKLPNSMKLDVMPERLARKDATIGTLGYAKTATDLLVIDPMDKTVIAVIPRRYPVSGKAPTPADWAATRGRMLIGKAPEGEGTDTHPYQPAGDSGDTSNGDVGKPK